MFNALCSIVRRVLDYLAFRILAEALIGSFTTRVRSAGRPRSSVVEEEIRLDNTKLHLPVVNRPKIIFVFKC